MHRRSGLAALAVAVVLWATFALTIRGIGGSGLTPVDAAVLRFSTPALLLAPWLPRAFRAVRRERAGTILAISLAGLPHFLLSAFGGSLTSAALVGLLLPGSVPLFVAVILAVRGGDRPTGRRLLALVAITLGVAATAVLTRSAGTVAGIGILLAAGCAWAVYTIALRHTRLDLISVVLVVCVPSALAALALEVSGVLPAHLGAAPRSYVAIFVVLQGIGTGIFSTFSYVYAVRCLGSGIPAVTGALSPVLTTLLAVPIFGEPVTAGILVALTLVTGGVVTYNRASARAAERASARASVRASVRADADLRPGQAVEPGGLPQRV
ncbi:DMT family transporter [Actinoplanes sp. L3-i22]|uniref:DMT family transporter n=1 Tax=Actinoplanes sp. L3-i22 TaxID=2836373 RepID=UPI001C750B96|nr:DMT family transporter [Actinoplanes sp. L3-i22]BCY08333.1 membrane protein [Actinoplanes sp. L3-i22]